METYQVFGSFLITTGEQPFPILVVSLVAVVRLPVHIKSVKSEMTYR